MTYDETVSAAFDPPASEPPPTAARMRDIFAQPIPRITVVVAPLTRLSDATPPAAPPPVAAGSAADRLRPTPVSDRAFGALVAAAAAALHAGPAEPGVPPVAVVTRRCRRCGEVVVSAGAGRCERGHRLLPAHRRRGR